MKKLKNIIKFKPLRLVALIIVFSLLVHQSGILNNFLKPNRAYAAGDLSINWSVPTGDPIFVVTNALPGDTESRDVEITNTGAVARTVAVKGVKTSELLNMSEVLTIQILDGVDVLYEDNLNTFFTDSLNPDGIALNSISPGGTKTYTFVVTFDIDAGNEYQNSEVVFDIIIGIVSGSDIPDACAELLGPGEFPIYGTSGNDFIQGTLESEVIITFEGNDRVLASLGDDCIVGGPGNDELRGEVGKDYIFGNEGDDKLYGGNNDDLIIGGEGNDQIRGENGVDIIEGNEGNDNITGGSGNDQIEAGSGNDTVNGENGNDNVLGQEDNDTLIGGNNNDNLVGGPGTDSANGQNGTDTCDAETETFCEL